MRRLTYYVLRTGDRWNVSTLAPDEPLPAHPDRARAQRAAEAAALHAWTEHRAASQVLVAEDDGGWHVAVRYGDLLDLQ